MTREEFVAELVEAIREGGYEGAIRQDKKRGKLKLPDAGEIGIDSLFNDLGQLAEARRREALAKAASLLLSPPVLPETWEEVQGRLLPIMHKRLAHWIHDARRQAAGTGAPEAVAGITEGLIFKLGVVEDIGTLSVPLACLEAWGVSPDDAFLQAGQNLADQSQVAWKESPEFPGAYASNWTDGRAASRLFLPRLFGGVPLHGRPVVLVPTPSTLLVAGDESETGLFHLARAARQLMEKHHLVHHLSALRLCADGESWEEWLPDPSHGAYEGLRYLRAMEERTDYDTQAAALAELAPKDALLGLPHLEVLLAGIGAMVRTATRLHNGPPQALPKADLIVLIQDGEVLGAVEWDELVQVMPWEFDPVPGHPPRYRVQSFPNEFQIGTLHLQSWREEPPSS